MKDEQIIELFFKRQEQAIEAIDAQYGKICLHTSYNIVGDMEDAKECVNDGYLGVWNAIPPAQPDPLLTFLLKIVRNISLNRYKKNHAGKRNSNCQIAIEELEMVLTARESIESVMEAKELTEVLELFLDSLKPENRVIFIRRYWFFDSYKEIGDRVGLTESNVSVRLTRLRKELRNYLSERGVFL